MIRELSQVVPDTEEDLFMDIHSFISHIGRLVSEKKSVNIIIGHYYDVSIRNATRIEIADESKWAISLLFIGENNSLVSNMTIPKDKMYKRGLNESYVEVVDGIDYSKDKYFGDIVRCH